MMHYEYKVVPAPTKPRKIPRGSGTRLKAPEAKFAYGIEAAMNEYAADGWEYLRADILPSEERRGLRSSQTVYRTVLVFRRAMAAAAEHFTEERAPVQEALAPQSQPAADMVPHEDPPSDPTPDPTYENARDAERRARFSLVGPARRRDHATEDRSAPPLSAPHVRDDETGRSDGRD